MAPRNRRSQFQQPPQNNAPQVDNEPVEGETLEDILQAENEDQFSEGGEQGNLQSALAEARERGRAAEERARALEARLASAERGSIERQTRLEERLNMINERLQQNGQEQIQIPDVMEDPLTHFRMKTDQLQGQNQFLMQKLAQLESVANNFQQQQQTETQVRGIMAHVDSNQRAFASQNPDYYDAVNSLRSSLDQQLQAAGYQHPVQRAQIIQQQFNTMIANALQSGRNPAEAAYMWAKTAGYQPADQLDQLRGSQTGPGRSMNSAPGRTPKQINLETIANLNQNDFDALINDERRFKALFN